MTEGSTENGTPEKKQRKKRVVLGNANGYVVQDHLKANLEFYKKEQFPIAVLCERLNRELGLTTVTEKNLRNNCIDAKFNLAEIVGPTPRKPRHHESPDSQSRSQSQRRSRLAVRLFRNWPLNCWRLPRKASGCATSSAKNTTLAGRSISICSRNWPKDWSLIVDCSEKYAGWGAVLAIAIVLGVDIAQNQKAIDKVAEATARIEKKLDELGKAEKP